MQCPFAVSILEQYGKEFLKCGFTPVAFSIVLDMGTGNR